MNRFRSAWLFVAAAAALALGQAQPPPPLVSPEVHADNRVTFRVRAPNAVAVDVAREGAPRLPMQKGDRDVWSVTTDPLAPDIYGYVFVVDGVARTDPANPDLKPNLLNVQSLVHVPGPSALPWEVNAVPHGSIHHHFYRSATVGDERDYYVYTPPAYDPASRRFYPVLYLLHGFSDDASAWTAVGRAHVMLDNLIAQAKATPMVVVMPLGYGTPTGHPPDRPVDLQLREQLSAKVRGALLSEVMPQVERTYRVSSDRGSRAIAGLSMGGAQALTIGLNGLDRFAWIGSFSGALVAMRGGSDDFAAIFPSLSRSANGRVRLLWIACGTEDRLIDESRKVRAWLTAQGITHAGIETAGAHTWMVWRRNLAEFAALLFKAGGSS